jgi:hypothetical protein
MRAAVRSERGTAWRPLSGPPADCCSTVRRSTTTWSRNAECGHVHEVHFGVWIAHHPAATPRNYMISRCHLAKDLYI